MPRLAASVLVAALVAAPGAGAAPRCARVPPGWQPHIAEASDWAKDRRGTVSFAVRTTEQLYGWRTRRTVPTASVLKAMLLAAYLDRGSVRSRALRAADLRLLAPMVRRSDDVAATRVRDIVGAAGLERRRVREAGPNALQGFYVVGDAVLEVIGPREPDGDGPASFWGLVLVVEDLDAAAERLGPLLGAPRDAVQPGRRIATVRREAGLGTAVALITPR